MNIKLQKPLTLDEVIDINNKAKGYKISLLPTYPTDYVHMRVTFEMVIPFVITRNEDEFSWFDKQEKQECSNTENMWVVIPAGDGVRGVPITQFHTVQKAVDYALREYSEYLQGELNKIKALKKEVLKA